MLRRGDGSGTPWQNPAQVSRPPPAPEQTGLVAVRELLLVWMTFWHRHWLTVVLGTTDLLLVAVMLVFLIFEAILWARWQYGASYIGAALQVQEQLQEDELDETGQELLDDEDTSTSEEENELDDLLLRERETEADTQDDSDVYEDMKFDAWMKMMVDWNAAEDERLRQEELGKMSEVATAQEEKGGLDVVESQQIMNVQDYIRLKEKIKAMGNPKTTGKATRGEAPTTLGKETKDLDAQKEDGDVSDDVTTVARNKEKIAEEVEAAKTEDGEPEIVKIKGKTLLVKRMINDGNSLFSSIAFLMYKTEPGCEEHKKQSHRLRRTAVRHLLKNKDEYRAVLLRQLSYHKARYADLDTDDEKIDRYLKDMAGTGFPAGDAIVIALSDYYGVDVEVFMEQVGSVTIPSDHELVTQKLAVLRSQSTNEYGEVVYHFDSIVDVKT